MVKFTILSLLLCVAGLCWAKSIDHKTKLSFEEFKKKFNKNYESVNEHLKRMEIFAKKVAKINSFNQKARKNNHSLRLEINKFSDLEHHEIIAKRTGYVKSSNKMKKLKSAPNSISFDSPAPDSFDWRTKNVVTSVKDQGQCGSCYAFATTAAVESFYAIKHNILVDFSEQEIVDCSSIYGNGGCDGGLLSSSFEYFEKKGVQKLSDYPYTGQDGECKLDANKTQTIITKTNQLSSEEEIQNVVANIGPVAIALYVSDMFAAYSSGVLDDPDCAQDPNHAVLIVGYGSENGQDYWLIKNSWGQDWGQNGYIKVLRNVNMCNVLTDPEYVE